MFQTKIVDNIETCFISNNVFAKIAPFVR